MNRNQRLATSPMIFGYRGSSGRLRLLDAQTGNRQILSGERGAELMLAFLEARSIADAESEGFTRTEIEAARAAGLIITEDEYARVNLWERAGWSRPAYLMFSQMNLEYLEFNDAPGDLAALTEQRRTAIEIYEQSEDYPLPRALACGPPSELPAPRVLEGGFGALRGRRSVRAFARRPPDVQELADILHTASASHRMIAADRASGDPYRLLNSLYSWAHLFVVVQNVDGVRPGAFEYDWAQHRLLEAAGPPAEEDLLAAVQGQRWVLGPGFAIFLVADLRGYAWLYRHSRAYLHVLIQVGELGQEILMAATELGLGGWTTPAVHESRTGALLGLPRNDGVEALSMVKVARPLRRRGIG